MEKKFYQDNFEQLLKESTENFRMYPSKRVWHGIYNNLHPSRRWPSLAIWLLMISSMIFIGLSNKNKLTGIAGNNGQPEFKTGSKTGLPAQRDNSPAQSNRSASSISVDPLAIQASVQLFSATAVNSNTTARSYNNNDRNSVKITAASGSFIAADTKPIGNNQNTEIIDPDEGNGSANQDMAFINTTKTKVSVSEKSSADISTTAVTGSYPENNLTKDNDPVKEPQDKKTDSDQKTESATNKTNTAEKEWIEDFAFHNKPTVSKWKSKVSYEFYFTPSVGYRILSTNSNFNPVYNSLISPSNTSTQDYKDALSQGSAVNMELGASLIYKLAKNWNLKAGLQLNYTNYAINVYELKHPTVTTLLLNDLNNGMTTLDPRSTNLANISGVSTKKLKNNTYQVSIPVGADFKIAGKHNLKWYVGGTIQPTYIAGGHSYLISSDMKNYVADNSLMRKWNLNAALETFISYKTKGGLTVNAGPLVRYQFLSTYSRLYTYNEKLYNIGFRFGIITRL